jgi:hypothetical protein
MLSPLGARRRPGSACCRKNCSTAALAADNTPADGSSSVRFRQGFGRDDEFILHAKRGLI